MTVPLSTFIIARNEADRIVPVLEAAAKVSAEMIVVDSGSSDETAAVARRAGAKVIEQPWLGYGPQKRFAEDQCTHDWLLNLDADEVLSPELVGEIQAMFRAGEPAADAYRISIVEVYPGEARPKPLAHRLSPVRLYRRDKGRYAASTVHDRVELVPGARVAALKAPVHHFSVRSLGEQIRKLLNYADAQADAIENKGRRISALRLVTEFPLSFLKAYILRGHFMRGAYGYAISINHAYYRHIRIAQIYERTRMRSGREQAKPKVKVDEQA